MIICCPKFRSQKQWKLYVLAKVITGFFPMLCFRFPWGKQVMVMFSFCYQWDESFEGLWVGDVGLGWGERVAWGIDGKVVWLSLICCTGCWVQALNLLILSWNRSNLPIIPDFTMRSRVSRCEWKALILSVYPVRKEEQKSNPNFVLSLPFTCIGHPILQHLLPSKSSLSAQS